jgi:hypothetical protein
VVCQNASLYIQSADPVLLLRVVLVTRSGSPFGDLGGSN